MNTAGLSARPTKEDVELLGNQIKSKKTNFLISAAEDISQRLQAHSPGTYRGWLNDTVGKLVLKHREILDALTALPGVLATLNYDGLIEQASNRKAVTWLREAKVQAVLRREITDAVVHMHGWFDEPESVVPWPEFLCEGRRPRAHQGRSPAFRHRPHPPFCWLRRHCEGSEFLAACRVG